MSFIQPVVMRSRIIASFSNLATKSSMRSQLVKSNLSQPLRRSQSTAFPLVKSNLSQPFRRSQSTAFPLRNPDRLNDRDWWIRVASTAAVVAGGTIGINWLLNRETRDALSPFEREYLHSSFKYLGGGLAVAAVSAIAMHKNGVSSRLMRMNPWAVVGISAVGGIGSMLGVLYTDPANKVQKHLCYFAFQGFQALTLSPLLFLNPALLARAGLYTAGAMGGLCWIGSTAKSEQYLYMGGPLMAGLVVVALSSLAPLILPVTALGTLAFTEAISLYGGLAVFSGFTLYDTQKILNHARLIRAGQMKPDPMRESISLELDFINIFVRMVSILAGQQRRK